MSTYTKSITGDFGGVAPKLTQLRDEIKADGAITPTLSRIDRDGDDIDIIFDTALDGGEQTALNVLVLNHVPTTNIGRQVTGISLFTQQVTESTYQTLGSFYYPGKSLLKKITNVKLIGYMEESGVSFDVRLFDSTNTKVIAGNNFSDVEENISDLGSVSNVPTDQAVFEVQAKTNGSDTVAYVKNVSIYYDK